MPKVEPFFSQCSSRPCRESRVEAYRDYDKKSGKPTFKRRGGLAVRVIEPARIPIVGELGEYTVKRHGIGVEFRRCYEFSYIDKRTRRHTTQTCTEKHVVNIPQKTVDCYEDMKGFLEELGRGRRGRPTIAPKVLAALACSKSGIPPMRVTEPLSPSSIAVLTLEKLSKVRSTLKPLIKSGRVKCGGKFLPVLEEKQCLLPKSFQSAFDEFVRSEKEQRKWAGFRKLFGEYVPLTTGQMPEATDTLARFATFVPVEEKRVRHFRPTAGEESALEREREMREAQAFEREMSR